MSSAYPVRLPYRSDSPVQLLSRPVGALLTVSADAEQTLNGLGIYSVFDLGASQLFSTARSIVAAATPDGTDAIGRIAADYCDDAYRDKPIGDLADAPVDALRQVDLATAQAINAKLGLATIRELSVWPASVIAREIINDAYGLLPSIVGDPERPDDLIPVARRYATERVSYDVIVMDRVLEGGGGGTPRVGPAPADTVDLVSAGGVDVSDVVKAALVAKPAVGAVLTYRQSWFPQGLALGHLLHSMALAPGESTRIAMVDWTRAVRATSTDDTTQAEALSAQLAHTRAIGEVTSAVAQEAQGGFSESSSGGSQDQQGASSGSAGLTTTSATGVLAGLASGGFDVLGVHSGGTSDAHAVTTGWASTKSGSTGTRSLNAQMTQNITDRTQQAANSVRNRRATTVMESSQKESETLSTRVVANYNHMHALTLQYFEVVQIYRTLVELSRVTPCLFVPMKLVTFTEQVLRRYRSVIAAAGLIPEVQALAFAQANQLAITMPQRVGPWVQNYLDELKSALGVDVATPTASMALLPLNGLEFRSVGSWNKEAHDNFEGISIVTRQGSKYVLPLQDDSQGANNSWFPSYRVDLGALRPADIASFSLKRKAASQPFEGDLRIGLGLNFRRPDGSFASDKTDTPALALVGTVHAKAGEAETPIFAFQPSIAQADLLQHLDENALHYSTAIWRSLDAATIVTLLASYSLGGKRLIENIDPVPVAVSGNYVLFRFYGNVDDQGWQDFLDRHHLNNPPPTEDLVPLPSGGVFAEAVLGRSNSAEKLDITRFWNWQDSPIPILPPEINPLQAGGKANDPNLKTAPLEGAVLNIVNPPSLPDPAGLAPLYNAIANGNMFRDMSGLAQTAALAQAAMQAAQAGAGQATTAAGQAQQVAANQLTDLLRLIAQVAGAAMTGGGSAAAGAAGGATAGGGASNPGVTKTPTNVGAMINQGKSMDTRGVSGPMPPAKAPTTSGGSADPQSEWAAYSPGGTGSSGASSAEVQAFTSGVGGGSSPLSFVNSAVFGVLPGKLATAWPKLPSDTVKRQIEDLQQRPNHLNQGNLGLCGEATFIRHVIQRDAKAFGSFAVTLLVSGSGAIGDLKVNPSESLRTADWDGLVAKYGVAGFSKDVKSMPPVAHWMILSALRNSENDFIDYTGTPGEALGLGEGSSDGENQQWYERSKLYSKVEWFHDTDPATLATKVAKSSANHILLSIDVGLITPGASGPHAIALESPFDVNTATGKVKFRYWCWAMMNTCEASIDDFKSLFKGAMVATF